MATGDHFGEGSIGKLVTLFPAARAVDLPVRLTRTGFAGNGPENVVIEFATPQVVLFTCGTPLEFAECVRLQNSDGSLDEEASVVAVQSHEGEIAVAARFLRKVAHWIVTL
jgi:hypothetical protein